MAFDLKNVRSPFNPQRIYKFLLTITDIEFDGKAIEAVTFPTGEVSADPFHLGGGEILLPSFVRVSSVTIEFTEDDKGSILRMLQDWKRSVVSEDGVFGYPGTSSSSNSIGFKHNGILLLLDTQNEKHTEVRLERMMPLGLPPVRMSYAESNKVTLAQEFSVDSVTLM